MPIIQFDPSKQIPPRTGAQGIDRVILRPGDNVLGIEELAAVEGSDYWRALVECGAVVVLGEPGPIEPSTLEGLNTTQARDIVANCYDLDALHQWRSLESRKGVLGAIDSRIQTLTQGAI